MRSLLLAGAAALALTGSAIAAQDTTSSSTNASPSATTGQAGTSGQSATTHSRQGQAAGMNEEHEPAAEIKQAQEKLKAQNMYKGQVDGVMGPETRQALMEFQKQNGLQQTGPLDDQTEQKLGITEQSGSNSRSNGTSGTSSSGTSSTGAHSSSGANSSGSAPSSGTHTR